jgi:phage shock protein PspC (stress-responsive transcriptional regulator)
MSTTEGEEVDGPGFELEQREGGGAPGGRAGYGRQDPSSAVVTRRAVVGVAAGVARVWEAGRRAARLMCVVVGVMPAQVADENGLLLYAVALLVGGGAHIDAVLVVDTAADGEALDETVTHDDGCESGFEVLWFGNIRRRWELSEGFEARRWFSKKIILVMVLDDQGQKERKARNIRTTTTNRHDGMEI